MTEALTVRLRKSAGRTHLWLAPAGGMGLSFSCCDGGHHDSEAAFQCGMQALHRRLLPTPAPATSAA